MTVKGKSKTCDNIRLALEELKSSKCSFDENYILFLDGKEYNVKKMSEDKFFLENALLNEKENASTLIAAMIVFGQGFADEKEYGSMLKWIRQGFRYDYQKRGWVVEGNLHLGNSPHRSVVALPDNLLVNGDLELNIGFDKLPEYLMVKGTLLKNGNKIKHPDTMVVKGGIIDENIILPEV